MPTKKKEIMKGMTQRYALFFDIDGTLVSFETHEIPPSTILALTQAKANGSRVYIATGRPPLIITNLGAIEHLIDGYITTNGALCFVGDELVSCQPIDKADVMTCVEDSKVKGYSLIIVGRKDVAVLDPKGDVNRIFRQMLAVKNLDKASPLDVVLQQDILQLTPFFPADYEPELMARMQLRKPIPLSPTKIGNLVAMVFCIRKEMLKKLSRLFGYHCLIHKYSITHFCKNVK